MSLGSQYHDERNENREGPTTVSNLPAEWHCRMVSYVSSNNRWRHCWWYWWRGCCVPGWRNRVLWSRQWCAAVACGPTQSEGTATARCWWTPPSHPRTTESTPPTRQYPCTWQQTWEDSTVYLDCHTPTNTSTHVVDYAYTLNKRFHINQLPLHGSSYFVPRVRTGFGSRSFSVATPSFGIPFPWTFETVLPYPVFAANLKPSFTKQLFGLFSAPSQPPAQCLRFGWPIAFIARFTNSSTYLLISTLLSRWWSKPINLAHDLCYVIPMAGSVNSQRPLTLVFDKRAAAVQTLLWVSSLAWLVKHNKKIW